jgi:hypothetical protein
VALAVVSLLASGACIASGDIEYFCPRSNVRLVNSPDGNLSTQPDGGLFVLELEDCSKGKFLCVTVKLRGGGTNIGNFSVVAPRPIRHRKELHFRDLRMLSRYTHDLREPGAPRLATLTVWHSSSAAMTPIEMTVESGRGVLYLDGIRLTDKGVGELCVLQSEQGILAEARVR